MNTRQRIGLELQRSFRHTQERLHPLRSLFWECTLRCNMNCRHCGSDCRMQPQVPDMPAADFLKVIDSLTPHVDPHQVFIIITGGEALLRSDLEEVGYELYRRGYPWGVVTNGYLLGSQRLKSLLEAGMHSMTISLDGLKEQHDRLRRTPMAYEHAIEAIKLLSAEPSVLWDVVTCVSPDNIDTLPAVKELLVSLGVAAWRLFSIAPMGRAANDNALQLSSTQLIQLLDFIQDSRLHDSRLHVSYACEGFLGEYEQRVRDHFFYCRSGVEVASVRCDGAISGCTSVRSSMDQGNIYRDDFWEVWQQGFGLMRDRRWAKKEQCARCRQWHYCEGSGLHLYDDDRHLMVCHYNKINNK